MTGIALTTTSIVASGMSSPLSSRVFRTPRHTTRYLESGPSDGPLMIFVHGWPSLGLMWRAQMDAFAAEGWRCIAPDLRGYGGSSVPTADDAYTIEAVVTDMAESMTTLAANLRSGSATIGAASWSVNWSRMSLSAAVALRSSRWRTNQVATP